MEPSTLPAPLTAALLEAGYRVGGPAGVGGGGPVWTAVPARAGGPDGPERVVVQVLTLPDGARDRLAERLEALWALDHPHLPAVVDVVAVAGGAGAAPGAADPAGAGRTGDDAGAAGGEVWAVLLAEVPGATVAALLASRGRLSPGELVTLTVPVAGALDALHRSGLVHGDVSPANVVVRPDGRPVLIDVLGGVGAGPGAPDGPRGTPGFTAPETASTPAAGRGVAALGSDGLPVGAPADVFALASVALAALDLAAQEGRLGDELRAGLAVDPVRRPTAAELAAALYACAEPEPIGQPDAGVLARTALAQLAAPARTVSVPTGGRHRAGGRRGLGGRRRGAAVLATAAVCGVGVAVGAGLGLAARGDPAPAGGRPVATDPGPAVAATPRDRSHRAEGATRTDPVAGGSTRADPVAAAVALTRRRAEVLDAGDVERLTEVVLPGSPAHRADRELLNRLAASGVALDGLAAVVGDASLVPAGGEGTGPGADPGTVDVRVWSGLGAHTRAAPSGATEVPAQPARAVVLRLGWTDDGWRVAEVRPG